MELNFSGVGGIIICSGIDIVSRERVSFCFLWWLKRFRWVRFFHVG